MLSNGSPSRFRGGSASPERTFSAGTPSLLRAINERTVLDYIREMGSTSRAQIARGTGLSKPTVSQALLALHRGRLVREAGKSSGGKGPAAVLYELNPRAGWVAGVDVGRQWVRAAIADLNGNVVSRRDERSRIKSADALISQMADLAHALAAEAGIRWRQVTVATVGSPGVFQPSSGQVSLAHNLPGWGRRGLVEALQAELRTEITFENDVNLSTVGEQWRGLGKDVSNFVFLHVGTGVGMGIVLNRELYRGSGGNAGEIAYLPLATADPHDPDNLRRGALEGAVGANGIVDVARRVGMKAPRTPKAVFAAARKGDASALKVVEQVAERIALSVAAVVSVVDPELVILGGGVGRNGDLLLEPVRRELASLSPFEPRIEISALGEEAALNGAVATALQAAQDRLFVRTG